jgi:hypothetical protein
MARLFPLVGLLAALLAAGCATTPASRIERDPALFASFSPAVQAKIRAGDVDVGFSKAMARMALGAPDYVATRTSREGTTEVWLYTRTQHLTRWEPVRTSAWIRDRRGRLVAVPDWDWVDLHATREFPVLRLEFEADAVKTLERLQ